MESIMALATVVAIAMPLITALVIIIIGIADYLRPAKPSPLRAEDIDSLRQLVRARVRLARAQGADDDAGPSIHRQIDDSKNHHASSWNERYAHARDDSSDGVDWDFGMNHGFDGDSHIHDFGNLQAYGASMMSHDTASGGVYQSMNP